MLKKFKIFSLRFILIIIFSLGIIANTHAQESNITFNVDMNTTAISSDGVHLAGSFQDWNPNTLELEDPDSDGIYSITVALENDSVFEYKFINGNSWGNEESSSSFVDCNGVDDQNGGLNRVLETLNTDIVLNPVCFGSCEVCPMSTENTITFSVDMSLVNVNSSGVYISGDFMNHLGFDDWSTDVLQLTSEEGNNIYSITLNGIPDGTYNYKFLNGNSWGYDENLFGLPCSISDGFGSFIRTFSIETGTTQVGPFCYEECEACDFPVNVTFKVDMTNEAVSPNGVHIAGEFQNWDPAASQMSDEDEDGIYELEFELNVGTYEFKYINGNNWDGMANDNESIPSSCNVNGNREITVSSDTTIQYCYNQCYDMCLDYPDPAEIVFTVDMSDEEIESSGVWIIGDFTDPQWQNGRIQMFELDDYPGVYSTSVLVDGPEEINYKFSNGEPLLGSPFQDGESFDFASDSCGIPNGIGGWNRSFTRSGFNESVGIFCYNNCENCNDLTIDFGIGIDEYSDYNELVLYPNPAMDVVYFNESVDYRIFATSGSLVLQGTGNQVDITSLTRGIYYLKSDKNQILRFIKF